MEFSKHYVTENDLLTFINRQYAIKGERIRLYRTSQGRVFFIHFDKVCMSYNVMDIGWLLTTDWLHYNKESLERSRRLLYEVYAGYSMEKPMTGDEIEAALHSAAIIHFEALGLDAKMHNAGYAPWLADREYEWLMRWREECSKQKT